MPRRLRLEFAGAIYHISGRGNERKCDVGDLKELMGVSENSLELPLIVFGPRTHRVLRSDLSRWWQSKNDDFRQLAKGETQTQVRTQ